MRAAFEEQGISFEEGPAEERTDELEVVEATSGVNDLKLRFAEFVEHRTRIPESPDDFDFYMGYTVTVALRLNEVLKEWSYFKERKCFVTTMFEKFNVLYGLIVTVHNDDWERHWILKRGDGRAYRFGSRRYSKRTFVKLWSSFRRLRATHPYS